MEGRVRLTCAECARTSEVSGEIPEEYTACFAKRVREEGWVPRPGVELAMICGQCATRYAGHETVDDEEKVRGERDPKAL
jgi:hypothetical protein